MVRDGTSDRIKNTYLSIEDMDKVLIIGVGLGAGCVQDLDRMLPRHHENVCGTSPDVL